MKRIRVIGVDAATKARRIGLACGDVEEGQCRLHATYLGTAPMQQIARWIDEGPDTILLGLDSPLGWPAALGEALATHQAGQALAVPLEESNRLFRRYTDQVIKARLGKQPLDIGADRIARTAHSILCRLHALGELSEKASSLTLAMDPSLGAGCHFLEVYPAATLTALGANVRGYKEKSEKGRNARQTIVDKLRLELRLDLDVDPLLESDDVLDAALCVLAGFDFLQHRAPGPQPEEMDLAKQEGWIWCRPLPDIEKARAFALKMHGDQKYGAHSYEYHLRAVVEVLKRFEQDTHEQVQAAWLHDVLEDTAAEREEVKARFGAVVADTVWRVTTEPGKNRSERHRLTYPKIAASYRATALKLADRIANVEESLQSNRHLLSMYQKEYAGFRAALCSEEDHQKMWAHLDGLLGFSS